MRIDRLRNKLLLSAFVISVLTALAYMAAVSWVIRGQHLDQSEALLQKAASVIADDLGKRQSTLLAASQQLATQHKLGTTIWYLAQYARSDLDPETLFNTYRQLAGETQRSGYSAGASKVAIYDNSGYLLAFALLDGQEQRVGFVERFPVARFQTAGLKIGEEISTTKLRTADAIPRVSPHYDGPLPQQAGTRYVVVDGQTSIEAQVPILDETFDPSTGKPETKQVGLVTMVQPLDQDFADQLARLTDSQINVFTLQGLSSGSIPDYVQPDWHGGRQAANRLVPGLVLNEVAVQGSGYYQGLIPLQSDGQPVGSIATLRSKEIVEKNTREMIVILGLIAAASLAFVIPFAWYFATSISRPLTLLSRIFRGAAGDGGTARLEEGLGQLNKETMRYGEMGDLTNSFIAMNEAVQQKIRQINQINASLEHTVNERTAALAAKEQESRTLIENSPDSIARYDQECRRIYANPAFCAMTGCSREQLLGTRPSENPGGSDAEIYESKIREVLATGKNTQLELKWPGKDGQDICSHIRLTPEIGLSGKVSTVLAVGRDISDRVAFEATIWQQANFDALTKLPNRQMFHDRLAHEALVADRSERPMALMLIDLDRFKEVNDTLGHDQGDVLLIEAARRITACVRKSDTVARLGGDEFTVILSSVDDRESIERVAQTIIGKLAEPFMLGAEEVFISASIGITLYPDDSRELDVLFKNADQAMYVAKNAGRNRFSYFTPDLQEAAQTRLRLTNDLRTALAGNQFQVHYQPIVDLATGEITKAEALIRWQHPERGMVSPVEFIPLAEETGLIVPIGDWVFKQAVQQAQQWRSRFHGDFQISVNKSPVQIRHEDTIFSRWPEYLEQQGMPGQSIVIEITEGLLLNAEATINQKLLAFRDAGIQVSIDDFGTGYSSLAYLKRFDIDYLKIDRSFIHNLGVDGDNQALCEAIIVMAHKLGLKVIAEGVETTAQRDLLIAAGCDFAQGYLYAKPLPPAQFEQWAWPDSSVPASPEDPLRLV